MRRPWKGFAVEATRRVQTADRPVQEKMCLMRVDCRPEKTGPRIDRHEVRP